MRPPKISLNALVLGLLIFLLLGIFMWSFVYLLNEIDIFQTTEQTIFASITWANWIAVIASVASLMLLAMMIIVGVQDFLSGRHIVQIYWFMLMFKALWSMIITLTTVPAVDRILHGQPTWTVAADPEVRLFYVSLFLLVAIVTYWMAFILYRGRFT